MREKKVLVVGDPEQMCPLLRELINEKFPIPVVGSPRWKRVIEITNVCLNRIHPRYDIVCIVGFRDLENLVAIVDEHHPEKDAVINLAEYGVAFVTGSLAGGYDGNEVIERIGDDVNVVAMDCFLTEDNRPNKKARLWAMKHIVYTAIKGGWLTVEVAERPDASTQAKLDYLKKNLHSPEIYPVSNQVGEQMMRGIRWSELKKTVRSPRNIVRVLMKAVSGNSLPKKKASAK